MQVRVSLGREEITREVSTNSRYDLTSLNAERNFEGTDYDEAYGVITFRDGDIFELTNKLRNFLLCLWTIIQTMNDSLHLNINRNVRLAQFSADNVRIVLGVWDEFVSLLAEFEGLNEKLPANSLRFRIQSPKALLGDGDDGLRIYKVYMAQRELSRRDLIEDVKKKCSIILEIFKIGVRGFQETDVLSIQIMSNDSQSVDETDGPTGSDDTEDPDSIPSVEESSSPRESSSRGESSSPFESSSPVESNSHRIWESIRERYREAQGMPEGERLPKRTRF